MKSYAVFENLKYQSKKSIRLYFYTGDFQAKKHQKEKWRTSKQKRLLGFQERSECKNAINCCQNGAFLHFCAKNIVHKLFALFLCNIDKFLPTSFSAKNVNRISVNSKYNLLRKAKMPVNANNSHKNDKFNLLLLFSLKTKMHLRKQCFLNVPKM